MLYISSGYHRFMALISVRLPCIKDALAILNIQSNQVTQEDIKIAYRRAATKYHPDHNPSGLEMMKMVNVAYDTLKNANLSTIEPTVNNYDYGDIINTALNAIIGLHGLSIEICGAWVWVGGDTKTHREILKNSGFFWAHKKALWYFRPETHKSQNRTSWAMDKIRAVYGQTVFNNNDQKQLASA